MTLLDELRDLIAPEDEGDDPPTKAEITERRREVQSEIRELEAELQRLESDQGKREELAEAETPEEVGRKLRETRDRLEGLEALDAELAARQREAERREYEAELTELVADLPDLADRFTEAEAELRAAREKLGEALVQSQELERQVERRGGRASVHLDDATVDRLERILERLPGYSFSPTGGGRLAHLRPPSTPDADPDKPMVIYKVGEGVRKFVGDWSRSAEHENPGRPRFSGESGWESDFSEAEGLGGDRR